MRSIQILSWNVHGRLALKLLDTKFRDIVSGCDIMLVQETGLRPGQEDALVLPTGFDVCAVCRPDSEYLSQSGGGVAAIYRSSLPVLCRADVHATDIMMIELDDVWLLNCYVPPQQSPWFKGVRVSPWQAITEILTACTVGGQAVIIAGDLNARTASRNAVLGPIRSSPDEGRVCSHGRELLDTCDEFGLSILNGSSCQLVDSIPRYTSFQHSGNSVIDYVVASQDLFAQRRVRQLLVHDHSCYDQWSDHAPLRFMFDMVEPAVLSRLALPVKEKTPSRLHEHGAAESGNISALDAALDALLARPPTLDDAVRELYGCVTMRGTYVQLRVVALRVSLDDGTSLYSVGIWWGQHAPNNTALYVPGMPTPRRADLYAVLAALAGADGTIPLHLIVTSEFVIRAICHWCPAWARADWNCEDNDILRDIVYLIQCRRAPLKFSIEHNGSLSDRAEAARDLALSLPAQPDGPAHAAVYTGTIRDCPVAPQHTGGEPVTHLDLLKVFTTLRPCSMPRREARFQQIPSVAEGAPRSLVRAEWKRLDVRLQALVSAQTDGNWWREYKALTAPKRRPPRVSAAELREVFMTRMNTPSILPAGFDLARKVANDLWARTAPSRTEDLTPEGFFRRRFTVRDIGGVKERIRANGLHKACGPDGIGYRELLRIDDEDLRMLFQHCVDDLDAPQRCLVSYLAAMGKKGKDLSDPNNYRTIGLESALVKFLTFLIDRRLREWEESRNILPPSQNGFRKGHRTNNNAFVLRTAIDEARSKDRTLYVLFVDLTNAFPSVNQPTLWRKLHLWGAQGPVIDWLRMLYSRMRYVGAGQRRTSARAAAARLHVGRSQCLSLTTTTLHSAYVSATLHSMEKGD